MPLDVARMWHDFDKHGHLITRIGRPHMAESLQFDDGEEFNCDKCERAIKDWDDMVQISVVDEETGDESDEEILCIDCHNGA